MTAAPAGGYVPPPYPYDRLDELKPEADAFEGGLVDFSIGTPMDPPAPEVVRALSESGLERGYPPSIGRPELLDAVAGWMHRRLGIGVDPTTEIAAAIGTKEFVAGLPHWMRLRDPSRDTVLYPEISYPSYEMGAIFAGCRAVPVPVDDNWSIQLDAISEDDAARALLLWVNTPGNPAGGLDDLEGAAGWGRRHGVPVFSDECYVEFTWDGRPRTILEHGTEGVVAVHSLSKRSNLAGVRVGFYAGDAAIVDFLREVRKHAGFMVPGPAQAAGVAALADQQHVDDQRDRYYSRLERMAAVVRALGVEVSLPRGGFYLWVPAPGGDAWAFTRRLAREAGALVAPGEFYGPAGAGHVRIAVVQPDDRVTLVEQRLGLA